MSPSRIPLWLKIGWTAWVALWAPLYWQHYGVQNFLWFCDLANFVILAALWKESPLLLSWQAVSVLLVQILWTVDLVGRLLIGKHLLGATNYMWDPAIPRITRLLSMFHAAVPALLLWGLWRLGYDRRAWICQTALSWVVLPVCFFGWKPDARFEWDINWVWGPFDRAQHVMAPLAYLGLCLVGYPLFLYIPTHLALRRLFKRPEERGLQPR